MPQHNIRSRSALSSARRIVVKVGSSSISGKNVSTIDTVVAAISAAHARGVEIILVSSGAIATGLPYLGLDAPPRDLATKQAAAAVGQNMLISRYQQSLHRFGIVAGQVLLTAGDLQHTKPRVNAQRAMNRLLALRVLPIVNENDTVATREIRFGDNDRLAALVSTVVEADLLILLSDVDALYTKPPAEPDACMIKDVAFGEDLSQVSFGGIGSAGVGTGGALTKVAAARLATQNGTAVLLTAATLVDDALNGNQSVGTFFSAA